ncbi:MAG: hypothetical protein ACTHU0_24305 [Kofleriaceae bacterium]
MIESFVDLTYRGLPLGRRIKLTQVRPTAGYLELSTPMPVGTRVVIATDEGLALDAVVTHVHEQVGGSDRVPGMTVAPALGDDQVAAWWQARIGPADAPAPEPPRAAPVTVRPRSSTIPTPPPDAAIAAAGAPPIVEPEPAPAGAAVEVPPVAPAGAAVEVPPSPPVALEAEPPAPPVVARPSSGRAGTIADALAEIVEPPADSIDETTFVERDLPPVVDDGKQTTIMESVDLSALGLDAGASGQLAAVTATEPEDDAEAPSRGAPIAEVTETTSKGHARKRKKRR